MFEVLRTSVFQDWYDSLGDVRGKARIDSRIDRITLGNLGDVKPVGAGVMEARVHHGPGYRIYFVRRRRMVIILLCGGDKGSQRRDIAKARTLALEV